MALLSRGSFISLGLVCTIASGAFNYGITSYRVQAVERGNQELAVRVTSLEAAIVTIKVEEATRLTKLEDGVVEVKAQLAHIDGRLSGVVAPAKGRLP